MPALQLLQLAQQWRVDAEVEQVEKNGQLTNYGRAMVDAAAVLERLLDQLAESAYEQR